MRQQTTCHSAAKWISVPTSTAVATMALLGSLSSAHAECVVQRIRITNLCNGCRYESAMSTSRDQACAGRSAGTEGDMHAPSLELYGDRIIQRAKHGIAGTNGNSVVYSPGKGYIGQDDFVVEASFRQGTETGKITTHWVVTVQ